MDDFRKELRSAFERSWSARPESAGLQGRVSRAVAADSAPGTGMSFHQVLASAAALCVLAIAVVGVGMNLSWLTSRHGPKEPLPVAPQPASPSPAVVAPSPSLAPEADYGPPPTGVPLVLYADPRNLSWLIAADWSGKPRGTIKLPGTYPDATTFAQQGAAQSPDGSEVVFGGSVYDRLGRSLGAINTTGIVYWADDNRHLCGVEFSGGSAPQYLSMYLPGSAGERLFGVGQSARQNRADPIVCSYSAGVALIGKGYGEDHDISAYRLSGGAVTFHRAYPIPGPLNPVATHDGKYMAESVYKQGAQTVIRDTTHGTQLASLPGVAVLGFSWDGSLVVTVDARTGAGAYQGVQVFDWRAGKAVWSSPDATLSLADVMAQPSGKSMVLALSTNNFGGAPPTQPYDQLVIVNGDGSSVTLANRAMSLWGGIKSIPGG